MLRLIGKGSYGEVWLARSVTGAMRAVKVLQRSDFQYDRTFEREFEGIKKFEPISRSHPGLVDVLHVGRNLNEGFYYYVMELGDDRTRGSEIIPELYIARTLSSDLDERGRLSVEECIDVGANLADGLHYLHQRGLTHRDVKPSNVIFVEGVAKLADIGLVAASGQRTFVGTEGFVPPEGPGSPEADTYSLGMVLYEISTGKDRLEFPELPERLPKEEERPKWRALNAVVCQAGAQKPKDRHATAGDFASALRRIKSGKVKRKTLRGRLFRTMIYSGLFAAFIMLSRHGDFLKAAGESRKIMEGVVTDRTAIAGQPTEVGTGGGEVIEPPPVDPPPVDIGSTEPVEKFGWVRIFSQPGVTVSDLDGEPVGIIPASGSLIIDPVPVGSVTYFLEGEGFASRSFTDYVYPDKPTNIGKELDIDSPPADGEEWANSFKMEFAWVDNRHVARVPVPPEVFQQFLDATESEEPHYELSVTFPDTQDRRSHPGFFVTRAGAAEFCKWMTAQSRGAGYLTERHAYVLNEDAAYAEDALPDIPDGVDVDLILLMCAVEQSEFIEVKLSTTPPDVDVYVGDRRIGTSSETLRLDPVPVVLTLKKLGYKSIDLELDLDLEKEKPVKRNVILEERRMALIGHDWTNDLGMQFKPLAGEPVLFGVHEVRVKDFRAFCKATDREWIYSPAFKQTDEHPVVKIIIDDARAFCEWLTEVETEKGTLDDGYEYRLPKDLEWSNAAGIPDEPGLSPAARDSVVKGYVWGKDWPPKNRTANLAGYDIPNYEDGFRETSPVGSFPATGQGFYDLAGNVWEWIDDPYGGRGSRKDFSVVRGGCFSNSNSVELLASGRNPISPYRETLYGFRVVIAKKGAVPTEVTTTE